MKTRFTELVGATEPLGAFTRSPEVVREVSLAGGLGVLAAMAYGPEELDVVLTKLDEELGGKPYGVDLLLPGKLPDTDPARLAASLDAQIPQEHRDFVDGLLEDFDIPEADQSVIDENLAQATNISPSVAEQLIDVSLSHSGVRLVASALGTPPSNLLEKARAKGVAVAGLVGSPKHARAQLDVGVDVIIAQGTEAGAHTGSIATMVLTPEIVDLAGETPVLAAGGIADGRQMCAALALGAAGAWTGSVWLSAEEAPVPPAVRRMLVEASSSDTIISRARTGKPARQLRSTYHDRWNAGGSPTPLPMPLQRMLTTEAWVRIDAAAEVGHTGALELESFFVGQVVGRITEIRPAREIVAELLRDFHASLGGIAELAGADRF